MYNINLQILTISEFLIKSGAIMIYTDLSMLVFNILKLCPTISKNFAIMGIFDLTFNIAKSNYRRYNLADNVGGTTIETNFNYT